MAVSFLLFSMYLNSNLNNNDLETDIDIRFSYPFRCCTSQQTRSTKTAKTVQSRCNEKQVSGIFLIKFNISYLNCIDCRVDLIVLHYASQGLNVLVSKNAKNCLDFS